MAVALPYSKYWVTHYDYGDKLDPGSLDEVLEECDPETWLLLVSSVNVTAFTSWWNDFALLQDHLHSQVSIFVYPIPAVYIWRDLFWKYNTQCFCLDVEQVQIKLTKFGLTNRQPKLADVRLTNKKTCRTGLTWSREAIPCQIYKVGRWGNN